MHGLAGILKWPYIYQAGNKKGRVERKRNSTVNVFKTWVPTTPEPQKADHHNINQNQYQTIWWK